jgi:two-component system sensor histidine kinase KdpD
MVSLRVETGVPAITGPGLDALSAETILLAMPFGVFIEDQLGSCRVNPELARIWRYESPDPPSAAAFRRDLRAAPRPDAPGDLLRGAFGAVVAAGRWRAEVLRRRDGTTVPVRVMEQALPGRDGTDVNVTYVMEAQRPEPDARLRQAFLAMMGHELRTPVSSIVAGAELLHGTPLDGATRDEVTALVVEEANRVNILIEQLTSLTLLHSIGSPTASEPVHMLHLVRRVGAREAKRRSGLRLRLPGLNPSRSIALGDAAFIDQVLTILIDNAAKYAAPNGEVEVSLEQAGEEVAVHVLDRGPGLQGANPEQLFELFERAALHAGDGRGTGIGLYVASQIVGAMHGRIWAADRLEGGADFGFALPVVT